MACAFIAAPPDTGLVQIRHGYRAQWQNLTFAVENDAGRWGLTVRDSEGRVAYRAERSNRRAAQIAALDFAAFRGFAGPAFNWQEYW